MDNLCGQDLPSKIQLTISYGDVLAHGDRRQIIGWISRHTEEFKNVVIIGVDGDGIEHTFDFYFVLINSFT